MALSVLSELEAQDPMRFSGEVQNLEALYHDTLTGPETYLFTGSSSIRMWKTLGQDFPGTKTVNTGFGGSQMTDLLYFYDKLILPYRPGHISIYEGDNDIAAGKGKGKIMRNTRKLVEKIRTDLPGSRIYLISAKPSLSRWHLKKKYLKLNKKFLEYSLKEKDIAFINVWDIMLNEAATPREDIFVKDGLHMNAAGYALWKEIFSKSIQNNATNQP